ncbi:hypothetical protein [Pseudomonas sp. CGJS7]|uniref:hypothetical protein n=1 Tax=Pseudomonas sp. CGJS7 TaxID=3109348 RepID=UPI0030088C70
MTGTIFQQAINFLHSSEDQHQDHASNDDTVEWNIKNPIYLNGRIELDFVLTARAPAKKLLGFQSRIAVRTHQNAFLAADSFAHHDAQKIRGGGYLNVKLPPGRYRGTYLVVAFVELSPTHQVWPMKKGSFDFEV